MSENDLREKLAALAHEQWSGWMKYLFRQCREGIYFDESGVAEAAVVIPHAAVERWKRQMNTPYADLPLEEKLSDREEADRVLALLKEGRDG